MCPLSLKELPSPPPGKTGWPWSEECPALPEKMPDGSPWPKISIVTPSYNQGDFIEETIRSILLQGYPNLEYFIFDGDSEDNSVEIIRKYEPWLTYWESEKDRGQTHALNKGIERVTGEIFHWLNSDDRLMKGALETAALSFRADPEAVGWVGSGVMIDTAGKVVKVVGPRGLLKEELARWSENYLCQPAIFINMESLRKIGPLDESLFIAFDFDLWLKLAEIGRFGRIDAQLAEVSVHPQAKTQAFIPRAIGENALVLFRNGFETEARDMVTWVAQCNHDIRKKVGRFTSNRIYRFMRPILKRFGLVG